MHGWHGDQPNYHMDWGHQVYYRGNILVIKIKRQPGNLSLNTLTIAVDAGHGGTDPGAVGQYENSLRSREKDITLAISKKLVAQLNKELPDVNAIPTRTTDIFQDVTK